MFLSKMIESPSFTFKAVFLLQLLLFWINNLHNAYSKVWRSKQPLESLHRHLALFSPCSHWFVHVLISNAIQAAIKHRHSTCWSHTIENIRFYSNNTSFVMKITEYVCVCVCVRVHVCTFFLYLETFCHFSQIYLWKKLYVLSIYKLRHSKCRNASHFVYFHS